MEERDEKQNVGKAVARLAGRLARLGVKEATRKLGGKILKKLILPLLGFLMPVILIAVVILVVIGGVFTVGDRIGDWIGNEQEDNGWTEDEAEQHLNDPAYMLDAIQNGKIDLSNNGIFLMDQATVERIFKHIVEYNEERGEETGTIRYGNRKEEKSVGADGAVTFPEMDKRGEIADNSDALFDTEWREIVLRRADVEKEVGLDGRGIFDIGWQEIFTACAMAARDNVDNHSLKSGQQMETEDLEDLDLSEYYLTNDQIDAIIKIFSYEFKYLYDPLKDARSTYRFKSFINLNSAFKLETETTVVENKDEETGVSHFKAYRVTRRVPAAAPLEVHNGFVKYTYNYVDNVCTSRDCVMDLNMLVDAMNGYVDDFDLDEYIELLSLLPGTTDQVTFYKQFVEQDGMYQPIITSTTNPDECSSIGVVYSPSSDEGDGLGDGNESETPEWEDWDITSTDIIYYDYIKNGIHRIAVKVPGKDYGIYKLHDTALQSFLISENFTKQQILDFFDSHPSFKNSGNILFNNENIDATAQAFEDVQREEGVSIAYFLAIMTLEGAIKTDMGAHWNFFNIEASAKYGRPPIAGHTRFCDYSQVYATPQEALKAEIRSIKTWYATNYDQTNAFLFCFAGYTEPDWNKIYHSYCPAWDDCSFPWAAGSGIGSPTGKGWPNNVGDYYYQYSRDLGSM